METGIYELKFKDGRIFRVFTANKKQRIRLFDIIYKSGLVENVVTITNGINTIKQFENIMNAENTKKGK